MHRAQLVAPDSKGLKWGGGIWLQRAKPVLNRQGFELETLREFVSDKVVRHEGASLVLAEVGKLRPRRGYSLPRQS